MWTKLLLFNWILTMLHLSDGTGYVEDGREIFDDDLDDDVVEKKGEKYFLLFLVLRFKGEQTCMNLLFFKQERAALKEEIQGKL